MKGAILKKAEDLNQVLRDILQQAMNRNAVDGVLVHTAGPEDTFPWSYVTGTDYLEKSVPAPPVMPLQGAKALSSIAGTDHEDEVLAVMRPCEARASIELSKLEQIELDNVIILSMECGGVVPLDMYGKDSVTCPDPECPETLRPLCRQCTEFSGGGDLTLARTGSGFALVPLTEKGEEFTRKLGLKVETDLSEWEEGIRELQKKRERTRDEAESELKKEYGGLEGLTKAFSGCVSCRSCRTVCPICYCSLCFIDMKDRRSPAWEQLDRSCESGAARLKPNTLLFHIGRMAHMSLSCVSCGMCEDACPADIPIGRLVSMVSSGTTDLFNYSAGADQKIPVPLNTYLLEELHDYED